MTHRQDSERAFDDVASDYDGWYRIAIGREVDRLEKAVLYRLAEPLLGKVALDVGTGTGHFAADLVSRGLAVMGVDISAPMLDVARSKGTGAALVLADAALLPVADARFDLVLSVTALEFVADRQRVLTEMWRALRPGGSLLVAVLNAWSPWAWHRRNESRRTVTPFSHAHFLGPYEFQHLLGQFGPVHWSSSVFFGPSGQGLRWATALEAIGQRWLRLFGALLVGVVRK